MQLYKKADLSSVKRFTPKQVSDNAILESVGQSKHLLRVGPGYVQGRNGPFVLDLSNVSPSGGREGASIGGAAGLVQ